MGLQLLNNLLLPDLKTGTTLAVFKFSGTVPVITIWFNTCSSGVVISCIVACSSLVDKPSKPLVHLVLKLRTISYNYVCCM